MPVLSWLASFWSVEGRVVGVELRAVTGRHRGEGVQVRRCVVEVVGRERAVVAVLVAQGRADGLPQLGVGPVAQRLEDVVLHGVQRALQPAEPVVHLADLDPRLLDVDDGPVELLGDVVSWAETCERFSNTRANWAFIAFWNSAICWEMLSSCAMIRSSPDGPNTPAASSTPGSSVITTPSTLPTARPCRWCRPRTR